MRILIVMLMLSLLGGSLAAANSTTPQLVKSAGNDFHLYRNQGRYYVIGSEQTLATYLTTGHIPYTLTLPGAGPMGETVVFEIDKNKPRHVEYLQKVFADTDIAYIFY